MNKSLKKDKSVWQYDNQIPHIDSEQSPQKSIQKIISEKDRIQ